MSRKDIKISENTKFDFKILNKLSNEDKKILEYKIQAFDTIAEFYPEIRKDRVDILNAFIGKYNLPVKYVLNKFTYMNKDYYVDPNGLIIDKHINVCGITKDGTQTNLNLSNIIFNKEDEKDTIDINDILS